MRIKTSDLAKLGQFHLQKGVWHEKRLLPAEWVEEATKAQIYQHPDRSEEENADDESAQGYGYQMWRCTHDSYRIDGANGQYAVVIPEKNVVIAITARVADAQQILKLIWEYIYPGIQDRLRFADEAENENLKSLLASLKLEDPFRTSDDIPVVRNETRTFLLEPNEEGIRKITFQWDETGGCDMTLEMESGTYTTPFGHDTWKQGTTERPGPYFRNPRRNPKGLSPFLTTGYSSWTRTGEFSLRLLYITDIQYETYICTFQGENLTIEFSHSMEPDKVPLVLKGVLQ